VVVCFVLSGSPPKSGPVELRVRKKFALLFCETKGLSEYIIKSGRFVKLFAFRFRHTRKCLDFSHPRGDLRATAHKYGPNNGTSRKIDFAHFLPKDWP